MDQPDARRRFDPVAFVEACYALDAALPEWSQRLARVAASAPAHVALRLDPHRAAGLALRESLARLSEKGGYVAACSARAQLRELARVAAVENLAGERDDAFFPELRAGRLSLLDRFEADACLFAVALRHRAGVIDPRALSERELEVVRHAALGSANKIIADALRLTESGAGTHLGRAMRKLGLRRRQEIAGAMAPAQTLDLRVGSSAIVVATTLLPLAAANLTSAEREVARCVLRGLSNREIARERGVSERTIANQIRSVFRKLGVSSRSELVTRSA